MSLKTVLVAIRNSKLGKNLSWTFFGNTGYAACQWIILVVLARLGDSTLVGQYSLGQALVLPITMCSNMQLRSVQAIDAKGAEPFSTYLSLRILTNIVAAFCIVGAAMIATRARNEIIITLLIGISRLIESMSDVYYGYFQAHEQMDKISKSLLTRGLLALAAITFGLAFAHSLSVGLIGVNCAWIAVFFLFDRRSTSLTKRQRRFEWDVRRIKQLAKKALPLAVGAFLLYFGASIPRFFLFKFSGLAQVGVFSVLASIQTVGMVFVVAIGQAVTPAMSHAYLEGQKNRFGKIVLLGVGLSQFFGLCLTAFAAIWGDKLMSHALGKEYSGERDALILISLAATLSYGNSMMGFVATATHRFLFQPWALGFSALTTAVGCVLWIPGRGAVGAAVAMTVGVITSLAFYGNSFRQSWAELSNRSATSGPKFQKPLIAATALAENQSMDSLHDKPLTPLLAQSEDL